MYRFLFLLFFIVSCQKQPPQKEQTRPVRAIQIVDPSTIPSRPFPGVTRAEDRVNLSFRVSGPLVQFPVNVGDAVEKGQILARIDPRDFVVALDEIEARLGKAEADLAFAESDFERAYRIQKRDPGAISERLVDEKREVRNRLRAEVKSLDAQIDAAEDRLDDTELRAPYRGVVVAKFVDNFEFIQARQAIVRLLDTSSIEMVVDIPEALIRYIPYVERVDVELGSIPNRIFPATIKEIGKEASITTRTFPVTLVMEQPSDVQVLAGMSGEARFFAPKAVKKVKKAIKVPVSALFSDGDPSKSYVWVVNPEELTVERREVTIGLLETTGIDILSGLKPGEWVVTAGVSFLVEGQKVTILEDKSGG